MHFKVCYCCFREEINSLVELQHGGTRSNKTSVDLDLENLRVGHLRAQQMLATEPETCHSLFQQHEK